jgi:hypothetical protein
MGADEGGGRTASGIETGGADGMVAGGVGTFESLVAGGFSEPAARAVADSGEDDFRLAGGGGGA